MVLILVTLVTLPLWKMFESEDKNPSRITRFSKWLHKTMLWRFTLQFTINQYAPVIIAAGINLYGLKFDALNGKLISSVLSLIVMAFSGVILFVMINIIKTHRLNGSLESESF